MGIETILIASAVGSSVMGAASSLAAGQAQANAQKFNAQVQERNAKIAEQEGEVMARNEAAKATQFQEDIENFLGAQAQAFRYNGVVASSGTPLRVRMESANEADEELSLREYNVAVGKTQAQESATQARLQANLNRLYGKQARIASYFGAGKSLLGGAQSAGQLAMLA